MYLFRLCSYYLFRILKLGINQRHSVTLTLSGSIRHAILALPGCGVIVGVCTHVFCHGSVMKDLSFFS